MNDQNDSGAQIGTAGEVIKASLAVTLLILYLIIFSYVIVGVVCTVNVGCEVPITEQVINIYTIISGVITSVVIAALGATKPGEDPTSKIIGAGVRVRKNKPRSPSSGLGAAYIGIWLISGLTALLIGSVFYPMASTTLADAGTTWLGLMVSSVLAYFGVDPG